MLVSKTIVKNTDDDSLGYIECVYDSTSILKSIYFVQTKLLYIAFGRGNMFSYTNVPMDFYDEFESSESQGVFFSKNIAKNKKYPVRKEFKLITSEMDEIKKIIGDYQLNKYADEID